MIVRVWTAEIVPGRMDEFCNDIGTSIWPRVLDVDGFLGGDALSSMDERRVVLITRWRDETALAQWAGPMWAKRPVDSPEDYPKLASLSEVQHYRPIPLDG